eukprot:1534537-Prymnesium_polylepis.1
MFVRTLMRRALVRGFASGGTDVCSVAIIGGGMVGTAAAYHLAEAGVEGVRVVCAHAGGHPSSSDDVSRLIGTGGAADDRSVCGFPSLQARSGTTFWRDVGLLEVRPAARASSTAVSEPLPAVVLEHTNLGDFFGPGGFDAQFTERGRGWLNPRSFVSAARGAAEGSGAVQWVDGRVERVDGEAGQFVLSLASGDSFAANVVVCTLGAFAPLSPGLLSGCGGSLLDSTMWGKVVYHARLTPASAEQLAAMPPMVVKPEDDFVPTPTVSYEGAKAGMYFYLFPPVLYPDGHTYIKIGHSPWDPVVASLGHAGGASSSARQPTAEQVRTWYAGTNADTSTAIGREVVDIVAQSDAFFRETLARLFPRASFDGGYGTTCVTAKSHTGSMLLQELVPGVLHQTGCNGAGAAAALAWGEEVSEAAREALARSHRSS